ncbi:hypothetical protein [Halorussus caseinilyticus]|uniref:Uncharacterized protein n=1 Tax=Halorussus caseinilyticus TaxID=3034025 RepID=A0ABD5WNX6_9EURY|nr:hypothetical protein [Halorussus sp. DT72]
MTQTTELPDTKPEVYDALRAGDITEEEARRFFGSEWDDVRQLSNVEDVLRSQPEPEVESDELYR